MGTEMQNDISTLLSESFLDSPPTEENQISSEDSDEISALLYESINKSKENEKNFKISQQEIDFVDSCLICEGDEENWEEMKSALIDALNGPSFENPNLDSDVEMEMERESESGNPNLEPREGIFGIWDLDFEQDSDEEIELIKDLKRIMKISKDGEEDLNLNLGAEKEKVDELVADLGNLSLNQIEGWSDKNL